MTDVAKEIVDETRTEMPSSMLLEQLVALLQQHDVDHIDITIQVRDSGEIAQLRVSLLSAKPRRSN